MSTTTRPGDHHTPTGNHADVVRGAPSEPTWPTSRNVHELGEGAAARHGTRPVNQRAHGCPDCPDTFHTTTGLATHRTTAHGLDVAHGLNAYETLRCRCDECKAAKAAHRPHLAILRRSAQKGAA